MKAIYNDGGRKESGFKGRTGDCVVRSIAIATEKPYKEIYNDLKKYMKLNNRIKGNSPRTGVPRKVYDKYLKSLGWQWKPTMQIGSGCKVHLCAEELPPGRLIIRLSKHITCVINGIIYDTFNPCRGATIYMENGIKRIMPETRCVYGYYYK